MATLEWVVGDIRMNDLALAVLTDAVSQIVRGYHVQTVIKQGPSTDRLTIGEMIESPPAPTKVILKGHRAACEAAREELEKQRPIITLKVLQT